MESGEWLMANREWAVTCSASLSHSPYAIERAAGARSIRWT
jgi:hypothetical protein